ncbi:MAG: FtsX-like permease family protein [Polyangiaceae bacterium]|jgi:putative ABC transport system permease protein|nr:FtsX-like permease family protein [Polyangiaceae bacterium]
MILDFKALFRNAREHKLYSVINLIGLLCGFTTGALLVLYILNQYSFDTHGVPGGPIYRVNSRVQVGGTEFKTATGPAPLAGMLTKELPGVVDAARLVASDRVVVKLGDQSLYEERVYPTESALFRFFRFEFLAGDARTCLDQASALVLTSSLASKYFGTTEVLGRSLELGGKPYTVTAVIQDPPVNAHFVPRGFTSIAALGPERNAVWASLNDYTYVRLRDEGALAGVAERMQPLVDKYTREIYARFNDARVTFSLQPLADIHFGEKLRYELDPSKIGSRSDIYLALFMAWLIIVLASANYAIIGMAAAMRRAKEIGIRKVVGADRRQLVLQSLFESLTLIGFVAVCGLGLLWPLLGLFNRAFGATISYTSYLRPDALLCLLAICLVIAAIGAGYPALYLSAVDPIKILKGDQSTASRKSLPLTSALLAAQLCLVMFIVASTWIVGAQFSFLRNTRLGFDQSDVARLELSGDQLAAYSPLTQELQKQSGVLGVASASATPGGTGMSSNSFEFQREEGGNNLRVTKNFMVDDHFVSVLGIQLLQGRFFDRRVLTDETAIVVNETLVREFGWSQPIGKRMDRILSQDMARKSYKVIGVVKDFHIASLYEKVEPVALIYRAENPFVLLKLSSGNRAAAEDSLKAAWGKHVKDRPFEARYVEDDFRAQYVGEQQKSDALAMFTGLTIVVAFIGVFGVASYHVTRMTKELAIRTVLGASRSGLAALLSRGFVRALVVGGLVAVPLAYSFMSAYLKRFAYHIEIGAAPFVIAAATVTAITALTVVRNVSAAVRRSPIEALKAE